MEALVGSQEEPAALAEHIRALQPGMAHDQQGHRERRVGGGGALPAGVPGRVQALPGVLRGAGRGAAREPGSPQAGARAPEGLRGEPGRRARRLPLVRRCCERRRGNGAAIRRWTARPVAPPRSNSTSRWIACARSLTAWYERNEAEKRALIAQARHLERLADDEPGHRWREAAAGAVEGNRPGVARQSQTLWDEFRGLCDAVYQRREQAYAQHPQRWRPRRHAPWRFASRPNRRAPAGPEPRRTRRSGVACAFEEIGELPRADARSLRDRFERAVSRYEAAWRSRTCAMQRLPSRTCSRPARLIRAYERAVMQGAPAAERAALKDAAESFIAGVRRWPRRRPAGVEAGIGPGRLRVGSGRRGARESAADVVHPLRDPELDTHAAGRRGPASRLPVAPADDAPGPGTPHR